MKTIYLVMTKQTCYDSWGWGEQVEEVFFTRAKAEKYIETRKSSKYIEKVYWIKEI